MKLFTLLTLALSSIAAAQIPEPLPDEAKKVLQLWVGKCDCSVDGEADAKGTATGVMSLGDRFIRDDFQFKDGSGTVVLQGVSFITYDTSAKIYRMWTFLSTGEVTTVAGKWDAGKRTLTATGTDAEKQHTTTWTSTFAEDGAESWKLVTRDKDGNTIDQVSGKSTPRKGK